MILIYFTGFVNMCEFSQPQFLITNVIVFIPFWAQCYQRRMAEGQNPAI